MEAYKPEILFLKQEDVIKAGLLDHGKDIQDDR